MSFADAVRTLANQLAERRKHVKTEEAVKQALILPFLSLLEYDIYNPSEIIPEYKAGWKTIEKVDYAVGLAGKLAMLIEAKGPDEVLGNYDAQLAKYFNATTDVKFAIISDGIRYKFFTDLQEKNILDKQPFFEFDFSKFDEHNITVLENFRKNVFNAEKLVSFAEDLVYLSRLKELFKQELREPSEGLVRYALDTAKLVEGRITQGKIDRFQPLIKQSISAAILEIVGQSFRPQPAANSEVEEQPDGEEAETVPLTITATEREAYEFTVSIVQGHLPEPNKLKYRKNVSYFAVMYGGSRKWFVRYTIDSRLKQAAYFRLPVERIRELAPFSNAEPIATTADARPSLGTSRVYFRSISELQHLDKVLIEAAQSVLGENEPTERKRKMA